MSPSGPALPKPIVLVGLMGVGKTTVGRALAEALGYRFIDNDIGIEAEYDATGAELAARHGVAELHRIEAEQLGNALDSFGNEPVVIAAAGSVVDDEQSRSRLREATVVWLQAPAAYLAERQDSSGHRRKLGLEAADGLAAQIDSRTEHFTEAADITVHVPGRAVSDIVDEIHTSLLRLPRMYTDLAGWFHLITAPTDYAEEAEFYWRTMTAAAHRPIDTMLELGSGGGNNAWHLKQHARLTLTDLSPAMLSLSRTINPDCEHVAGDMRTVRLQRRFDAVFIHDAVEYLTEESDVRRAVANAAHHVEPGGVVLLAPSHVAETFRSGSSEGGHTDGTRTARYEERSFEPAGTSYIAEYTYWLTEADGTVRVVEDRHELGLFPRAVWLEALAAAGLEATMVPFDHSEVKTTLEVFVGVAPTTEEPAQ